MADNSSSSQNNSSNEEEGLEKQREQAAEELAGELGGESSDDQKEKKKGSKDEEVGESLVADVEEQLTSSLGTGEVADEKTTPGQRASSGAQKKTGKKRSAQKGARKRGQAASGKKKQARKKQQPTGKTSRGVSNVPAGASKPETRAGEETEASTLPRLRTYRDDAAAAMQKERTSLSDIAAAEQDRQYEEQKQRAREAGEGGLGLGLLSKKMWIRVGVGTGAFILLAAGGAGIYFFGSSLPGLGILPGFGDAQEQEFTVEPPELIPSNTQREVVLTGRLEREALHEEVLTLGEELSLSLGNIANVFFTQQAAGGKRVVSVQTFFNRLGAEVPSALSRGTEETFMFGFHAFDGHQPFLILQPNSFETAFSGMLEWEERMNEDLAPLFGPEIESFVGTTTEGELERRTFSDRVIENQDVRALEDEEGTVRLLYAFPRRDRLIITTDRNTLMEVLRRMRTTRVVQ